MFYAFVEGENQANFDWAGPQRVDELGFGTSRNFVADFEFKDQYLVDDDIRIKDANLHPAERYGQSNLRLSAQPTWRRAISIASF